MANNASSAFLATSNWKWDAGQIVAYIREKCTDFSAERIEKIDKNGKADLRAVYNKIIVPSLQQGSPFLGKSDELIFITVRTKHKIDEKYIDIPITDFYTALGKYRTLYHE
ncbi:hypothetical protein PILCRDRAFT_15992 [Piloderma croceum F 1598]|uniref:Uncharacterized protein n=1 Tax=Piloderma croceum (strain F 1598) TaxID=765440 RepID=A0A0C3EIY5_PILCF|nr:hypothetical protein PILCRDRAFT_15992 [Piloderma croceum F 1598]